MVLRNWMMAAFFVGATFSLVACDDDDNETPPPAGPDATVVVGSYSGTMQLVEAQPKEGGEGEEPAGTELEAAVTKDAVEFENFPIRSLIEAVLGESGTDEVIDGIIEAVGPVGYTMPYTATINEKAKLGTNENTNEVTLEYQNNPYIENDYKEKKDEVRVFTFKLNVDKVDGKDKTTPLAGAEFELYHSENDAKNGTNPVMFVAKDDGTYRFAKKDDTPTTKTLVTDASGNIKVEGLKDGTYWLKETKAPAEYNKAVNPFEVKLEQMKDNNNKGTANLQNGDATIKYQKNEKIENNKGTIIPSTGGMGTTVIVEM